MITAISWPLHHYFRSSPPRRRRRRAPEPEPEENGPLASTERPCSQEDRGLEGPDLSKLVGHQLGTLKARRYASQEPVGLRSSQIPASEGQTASFKPRHHDGGKPVDEGSCTWLRKRSGTPAAHQARSLSFERSESNSVHCTVARALKRQNCHPAHPSWKGVCESSRHAERSGCSGSPNEPPARVYVAPMVSLPKHRTTSFEAENSHELPPPPRRL